MVNIELTVALKELFALGGNHNPERLFEVRKKISNIISEKELYLKSEYSEDFEIAKNALRLIDATNAYAIKSDRMEGYAHMKLFFEHLVQIDAWSFYDIQLLIISMNFIITVEEAVELASKAVQAINRFKADQNTDVMEGVLACNMCSRLLYAKYFDDDVKIDLAEQFNSWFSKLEQLTESNYQLDLPLLATQIRQAIFNQNQERILELCEELKENYEEDIENGIKNGVSFYTNSERYNSLLGGE